jgi:hypothetical protein
MTRYHYEKEPGSISYRFERRRPTEEERRQLREWAEEVDRRARERLKRLYGERQ